MTPNEKRTNALQDPTFVGKVAIFCVTLQVLTKLFMALWANTTELIFVATVTHMLAFLGSIIAFLLWVYRAASNVRRINRHTNLKPGWVVGFYFIPFANWVAPIISMREIIQGSFILSNPGILRSIAVVWWLAFVLSGITQRFVREDPVIMGIWFLLNLVSWICLIVLIIRISRAQASFRWPDVSQSHRPMMLPLGVSRAVQTPPIMANRLKAPPAESKPESDIESGWGAG